MKRSAGVGFAPNGEFDETCTNRVVCARRARSTTISVPPTFTSKNSRVRRVGWMTAAAWKTAAPSIPSKSRSAATGSRTSPTTTSMFGPSSSSSGASSVRCTRQRTRARLVTSARTRFVPNQPEAPVTTATGDAGPRFTAEETSSGTTTA